ncbi:DUF4123 domain-containing protein [Szabonella alba]|uniref:DUF4123 domain-containing protein n=1 Tax=Szabonella alba TaxID=2804194 RepID=A0A8K0V931_9RHOB|nr:DUF4123 domain-containing protein [Szabonella alba]MBL4916581.1 DUF4123 domain-containing protein [Szabonella alba]
MEGPGDPILPLLDTDGAHVFAVIDGAKLDNLQLLLHRLQLDPKPLYFNHKNGTGHAAGPHLVACPDAAAVLDLRGAVPADAVVWWLWPGSDRTDALARIFRHLRGLGKVEIPAGYPDHAGRTGPEHSRPDRYEQVLFRHADPHVLAQVLPVLTPVQRSRLYGKACAIVIDDPKGAGLRIARIPGDLPAPQAGFLRLTADQMDAITDRRLIESHQRIADYLRRTMPAEYRAASDDQLAELVQISDSTGRELGLRSEQAQCRWAYLMMLSRGAAADLPEVRETLLSAPDPDARVKELMTEAAEALRSEAGGGAGST